MNLKRLFMDYLPIFGIFALIAIVIIVSKYRPDGFQTQSGSSANALDEDMCSVLQGLKTSLEDKLARSDPKNKVINDAVGKALDATKVQLTNQGCSR